MKKTSCISNTVFMGCIIIALSCKKEGCIDPKAVNYDANAQKDDGSCIFPVHNEPEIVSNPGTGVNFDDYTYKSIVLGNGQEWMAENLRTTKYANGDPIPNVTDNSQWEYLTTDAWAHFNNDTLFENPYGKLYNWYAVNDARNVCPVGWHVPSDAEWSTFINYLDPNADGGNKGNSAGGKMKSAGFQYWQSPNTDATNEIGFSGLPGGNRSSGIFVSFGRIGCWWSSTELDAYYGYYRDLSYNDSDAGRNHGNKTSGLSVRCLKD